MIAAEDLPTLAMSRPLEAVSEARLLLGSPGLDAIAASYAHQALAIVARDSGRVDEAMSHLRAGLRLARRAGAADRVVDLSATLGVALAFAGRRRDAMIQFDRALSTAAGEARGRVLVRRGAVHWMLGDPLAATRDLSVAKRSLSNDSLWLARALLNRGLARLQLGQVAQARRDYARCRELYADLGQEYEVATVLHNEGEGLFRAGRLPDALARYEQADEAYRRLGVELPELATDRAAALLTAGLPTEALAVAERAVVLLDRGRQAKARLAGAFLLAGNAAMAAGQGERASHLANRAEEAARTSGNERSAVRARFLALYARASRPPGSSDLLLKLVEVSRRLDELGLVEGLEAQLLVGQVAEATGRRTVAMEAYRRASSSRLRGLALRRAVSWLASARLARLEGDRRRTLRACGAGLDVLDTHRLSLGSTELRAAATAHGRDLAAVAVREVLARGSGRDLLRWTERWRATVLDTPSVSSVHGVEELRDLAALRSVAVRALRDTTEAAALENERGRLEERIRRRTHTQSAERKITAAALSVDEIVSSLPDGTALVAIARVDGVAHVVVARNGRVRRFQAGSSDEIDRTAEFARFVLRSAAMGTEAAAAAMTAALEDQAAQLQELLFGPAVKVLGDGPVVMVPPAQLQSIPWDALPAFRDRPISVSPSASAWLRSCRATKPRGRRVALVTGPRLESAGAEIPELAQAYKNATVLGDGAATCDATMKALDGAWLAHVAAHGTIRTDNPMFSALELDDGPLTVYDLERLRRAPYRLVLSVCESAVGAATGADELLGLSSALIGLGTAGLLAAIVQVNDEATVPFSLTIHERLRAGDDLATALMHARQAAGDDPVARATAYSFLALGAA
jgi:CHAT domain-containing protein/tetratricopeptide (TPR) repeat protein